MRNHNTLTRDKLIPELAKCVPEGHTVSLDNPELVILVEVFKVRTIVASRCLIASRSVNVALFRVSVASAS